MAQFGSASALGAEGHRFKSCYPDKQGYRVTSPADLGMESSGYTWNDCMRSAITKMLECDAISLLDGWENSKGAKIELEIAKKLSMPIYTPGTLVEPAK